MRGKKRPTADKARAVGIAVVDGASAASRATGIPRPTIVGWTQEPQFDELRQRKAEVVEEEWDVGVQMGFRRAVELLERTDDPVKAATAAAIIYDKLALRRGQVTGRLENVSVTNDLDPEAQRRIRDWLGSIARGEAGSSGTGDGVALPSEGPAAATERA